MFDNLLALIENDIPLAYRIVSISEGTEVHVPSGTKDGPELDCYTVVLEPVKPT